MSNHIQSEDFQQTTFITDVKHETTCFTIIPKDLIRDESISPSCRWLIMYLLSNKEGHEIHIPQIIKDLKGQMGRYKIHILISEAVKAGYIKREYMKKEKSEQAVYTFAERCFKGGHL